TVTNKSHGSLHVDVMPETIHATSLASLTKKAQVNLERALRANDRMGGHFVTGHVDGTGKIIRKEVEENAVYYDIQLEKNMMHFMMKKGSVAVDGISLTIFDVQRDKNF